MFTPKIGMRVENEIFGKATIFSVEEDKIGLVLDEPFVSSENVVYDSASEGLWKAIKGAKPRREAKPRFDPNAHLSTKTNFYLTRLI